MTYRCKYCGKEFDSKQKLGGHIIHCKLNPKYAQSLEHLKKARAEIRRDDNGKIFIHKGKTCTCQYCGKQYKLYGLKNHERYCDLNPNKNDYQRHTGGGWNKGKTILTDDSIKKQSESLKKYYESHDSPNKGVRMSETQKEKIRLSTLKYIKNINKNFYPRYNKKACIYINELNKKFNWNLQHAENGGEFEINGYFIDGYDPILNIAVEYDEKSHYIDVLNNILCKKDILRQQYIIEKLNCEFYRYNEYLDKFYKVN